MREDNISVKKCPKFIAHNFRMKWSWNFVSFVLISFKDMTTKKQQQEEKAKHKFARNQQIVGPLRAGWNAGKWQTSMVSAIPGQRSSVRVWGKEIVERENNSRRSVLNQRGCEATWSLESLSEHGCPLRVTERPHIYPNITSNSAVPPSWNEL